MRKVRDWMTPSPKVIGPEESLSEAWRLFRRHGIRHLPVVEGEAQLVGLLTQSDILRAAPSSLDGNADAYERVLDETKVSRVMVRHPETVTPETSLAEAATVFVDRKFGALPVALDGKLVGILSQIDVLRAALPLLKI